MSSELRNCPFCGCADIQVHEFVNCPTCLAAMPNDLGDIVETIACWNERVNPQDDLLREALEVLGDTLTALKVCHQVAGWGSKWIPVIREEHSGLPGPASKLASKMCAVDSWSKVGEFIASIDAFLAKASAPKDGE